MGVSAAFGFVAFCTLLAGGVPIYVALVGVATVLLLAEGGSIAGIGQDLLDHLNSTTLMAVPFFVMAAVLMQGGGIARVLIDWAASWVGRVRGGIPIAAVMATAVFAAINGSSVATAMAMGTLTIPEMQARGYARRFAIGLMATAGTLGILIPPSLPLVLYGLTADESIPRLFLAGVVPGLVQVVLLCAFVAVRAAHHGGRPEPFPGLPAFVRTNVAAIPALLIPVVVFGGIYGGIVTVTEAAALSAAVALVVGVFLYRTTRLGDLPALFGSAVDRTAAIIVIVIGATLLSAWITRSHLAAELVQFVTGYDLAGWQFLLIMDIILLVLGMFLEGISIILITVPLTVPVLDALGIDRVHYAIVLTIAIELAMLTPPVGLNLFVMAEVAGTPVMEVVRGVLPFLALMIGLLAAVTFVPELSTALPDLLLGKGL